MKPSQSLKEPQKITLGLLIGWILGVLFLFSGVVFLVTSPVSGLLTILAALVIFPPANNYMRNKFNFVFSGILKFIIFVVFVGIAVSTLPKSTNNIAPIDSKSTNNQQASTTTSTPVVEEAPTTKVEKSYQQVFTFNGNGAKKSEPFTISGDRFKIAYDCSGSLCQAYLYEVGTSYPVDVFMNNAGSTKDETIEYKNGEFYIQSNSLGAFKMTIYDYK